MQKFRKSGMKKQKDKANTPNLFCLMLKVAFIQNLQIIYYIQELSNSLKKKKKKKKKKIHECSRHDKNFIPKHYNLNA